jgi:hypothetical protein
MMETKNPHVGDAGASHVAGYNAIASNTRRTRLQANTAMANRLTWLMRLFPYFEEARL